MTLPQLPQMKTGLVVSVLVHMALLVWGLVSFAVRPLAAPPVEVIQTELVTTSELTQLAKGAKDAKPSNTPTPQVDKVGEQKSAEDTRPVEKKPEIQASAAEPPPPAKEPEAKPEKKQPDKKPPPKNDPIADALKKEEARKAAENKPKPAPQTKPQPESKFDPNKIAALLDKRAPRRNEAVGQQVASASLGFSHGQAAQLSQSELDALRARLSQCWSPPVGAASVPNLKVVLRVQFKQDGSVIGQPELVAGTNSPYGPAMAESAKRALLGCQPFTMLRPEHYQQWKDIEITFDPRDMFRG